MFELIAVTASFVVQSNKEVSAEGILPENSTASYHCSYKKGQLTAGNTATLTLSGWENIDIQSVKLSMKSNKAAGAGFLEMRVDDKRVWAILDSGFDNWYGSYSSDYVPIVHSFSPAVRTTDGAITITISASQNSLYIAGYEIAYTKAAPRPYEVSLMAGTSTPAQVLTESAAGSGVLLPSLPDEVGWWFIGWSESPVNRTAQKPDILPASERFYPHSDTRLWAVYTDYIVSVSDMRQCVDLQSDYYIMAYPILDKAFAGPVENATLPVADIRLTHVEGEGWYECQFGQNNDWVYYIDFAADSTASIVHAGTGTHVGYNATHNALSRDNVRWRYRLLADTTVAFYTPDNDSTVATLWVTTPGLGEWEGKLLPGINARKLQKQTLLYKAALQPDFVYYTSYPNGTDIVRVREDNAAETVVPFGIYELYIRDGKKKIKLRN